MHMGIIYKATSPSKKIYIGQTIQEINMRKNAHFSIAFNKNSALYNTHFSRAIRKYGKDKIKWEILYKDIYYEQLNDLEIATIIKYNSFKNGYNSTEGGEGAIGYKHTTKSRAKMSASSKGTPAHNKGKKASQETKDKLSKMRAGDKHPLAKLNWKKVNDIRSLHREGYSYGKLAKKIQCWFFCNS